MSSFHKILWALSVGFILWLLIPTSHTLALFHGITWWPATITPTAALARPLRVHFLSHRSSNDFHTFSRFIVRDNSDEDSQFADEQLHARQPSTQESKWCVPWWIAGLSSLAAVVAWTFKIRNRRQENGIQQSRCTAHWAMVQVIGSPTNAQPTGVHDVPELPPLPAPEGCAPVRLRPVAVQVGQQQRVMVVLPVDEGEVLNLYDALGWLSSDPYWAALWPSAHGLAGELLRCPELVYGKRVLDLGCGVGLTGIVAALVGAKEVVFADREPRALHCALQGALLNGLQVTPLPAEMQPFAPPLLLNLLDDGSDGSKDTCISATCLDWNFPDSAPKDFDVVLACDVLYEKQAVEPVANIVPHLLRGDGSPSMFLLADPPNRTPANRLAFLERVAGSGQPFTIIQEAQQEIKDLDGKTEKVQIVMFQRLTATTAESTAAHS